MRSRLDRVEPQRSDEEWIAALWAHRDARVVHVGPDGGIQFSDATKSVVFHPTADSFDPQSHLLIGIVDGQPYFVQSAPDASDVVTLRSVSYLLDETTRDVVTTAVALNNWHSAAPYCGECGGYSEVRTGGHSRECQGCGRMRFPRTDPAMIVAVTDAQDRLLLARPASWVPTRMSLVAGFVEAGECLEQAVVREVAEEVGLRVRDVTYLSSQAWPFPRSLMVGFHAIADYTDVTVDGEEVEQARWFSRADLAKALDAGEVSMPGESSIAHKIITAWRNEAL